MNRANIVRRYPLVSYLVLACLVGWNSHIRAALHGGWEAENFPLGPIIAAFIVVSCQGREQRRAWWRQVRSWRVSPRWYALALVVPLVIQVLIVFVNHGLGAPLPTSGQLADSWEVPITFVMMLVFVGIGEETGWTLFAAPILLRRHGLLVAWAIAAGIRIFWHLPMMLNGSLSWTLGVFGNAAFTMVTLQLLMASRGRWTLVAVLHASLNCVGGPFFFAMVTGADRAHLDVLLSGSYAVVAVVVLLVGGRRLFLADPYRTPSLSAVPERVTTGARHDH